MVPVFGFTRGSSSRRVRRNSSSRFFFTALASYCRRNENFVLVAFLAAERRQSVAPGASPGARFALDPSPARGERFK